MSLVDKNFIATYLTADDSWCTGHGSDGCEDLGAGMLYYALAYSLRSRTCVCLGSGGGFVPRLMRQAQRDLDLEGSRTILVDGAPQVRQERKEIWGSPDWLAEDSTFYGDMFAHVVQWRGELYLEDGLHRALRCALAQRRVLHARVHAVRG